MSTVGSCILGDLSFLFNANTILRKKVHSRFPLDLASGKMIDITNLHCESVNITSRDNLVEEVKSGRTVWFEYSSYSDYIELDSVHREVKEKSSRGNLTVKKALDLAIEREISTALFHIAHGFADLIVRVTSR